MFDNVESRPLTGRPNSSHAEALALLNHAATSSLLKIPGNSELSYPLPRIAVLIDGENVSHRHFRAILEMATRNFTVAILRIYGDWSLPNLKGWGDVARQFGIRTVHQAHTGKSSADLELMMDATEISCSRSDISGFVVVSSDADFGQLCMRLRDQGKIVIGIGEEKTPLSYRNCCSEFVVLQGFRRSAAGNNSPHQSNQLTIQLAAKTSPSITEQKLIAEGGSK